MLKKRIILIFIFIIFPLTCFNQTIDRSILEKLAGGKISTYQPAPKDTLREKELISTILADTLSMIEKMFKERYLTTPRRTRLELLKDSLMEEINAESLKIELRSKYEQALRAQNKFLTPSDTMFFVADIKYFHLKKKLAKVNKQLDSLYVTLRQFGYDIFKTSLYGISAFAPVAGNYILGPGDELYIEITGELNESWAKNIDRDGSIVLPYIGSIKLWGYTYDESKKIIEEAFRKEFSNIEVSVSLGNLKSVGVFALGEVNKPGIYNITVISDPLASLFEAGGPKKSGSLRKIKYISTTGATEIIDLYKLFVEEKPLPSFQFSSGDILFVSPIGEVVGIRGAVNRPGIYEIKSTERLSELIEMAGGFLPTAGKKRIQLERISPEGEKITKDLNFEDQSSLYRISKNIKLENGDLVSVFEIPPYLLNYVEISGNVKSKGTYALKDGMTVLDLIKESGGLRKGTYMDRAELLRFAGVENPEIIEINLEKLMEGSPEENITLKEWDKLRIFSNEDLEEKIFVEISGEVEKPDSYPLYPKMKVKDLVFAARPKISAKKEAELFRIDPEKGAYVEKINLENIDDMQIFLQPGDYILVKRKISYREIGNVHLKGEFTYPGSYPIRLGTSLKAVIDRAEGFTENAYPEGAIFRRVSVANAQDRAAQDLIIETRKRLLAEQRAIMGENLSESDKLAQLQYLQIQERQLSSIERVQNPGRVVINLLDPEQLDMPLEDGDSIYVPLLPKTVQIIGEVYNPTGITYEDRLSLKDYLAMAGGPKPTADKKEIYIRRASGKIEKKSSEIKPGDTIVVPAKVKIGVSFWQVVGNTVDILYKVALAVLAFSTLTAQ